MQVLEQHDEHVRTYVLALVTEEAHRVLWEDASHHVFTYRVMSIGK